MVVWAPTVSRNSAVGDLPHMAITFTCGGFHKLRAHVVVILVIRPFDLHIMALNAAWKLPCMFHPFQEYKFGKLSPRPPGETYDPILLIELSYHTPQMYTYNVLSYNIQYLQFFMSISMTPAAAAFKSYGPNTQTWLDP